MYPSFLFFKDIRSRFSADEGNPFRESGIEASK